MEKINLLKTFLKKLSFHKSDSIFNILKNKLYVLNNKIFLSNLEVDKKEFELELIAVGNYIGQIKNKKFKPSLWFCQYLFENYNLNYVKINERASWLFICGRNIFNDNILQKTKDKGFLFVVDENKNVLGLAELNEKYLTNKLDLGLYIRLAKKDLV